MTIENNQSIINQSINNQTCEQCNLNTLYKCMHCNTFFQNKTKNTICSNCILFLSCSKRCNIYIKQFNNYIKQAFNLLEL